MKNLSKIEKSLSKNELKSISGGLEDLKRNDEECGVTECFEGKVCDISSSGNYRREEICLENVGMNCDSSV